MMMSSSLENYFGLRTSVRVKTDDFVSLSWNLKKRFEQVGLYFSGNYAFDL